MVFMEGRYFKVLKDVDLYSRPHETRHIRAGTVGRCLKASMHSLLIEFNSGWQGSFAWEDVGEVERPSV